MTWRKGNRLKQVSEGQAEGDIAETYREMRKALGVPRVDGAYQALAAFPEFLKLHWRALQPIVSTQKFFELADRMRADCYTRMHGYFEIPDLGSRIGNMEFSTGAQQELMEVVELHNYSSPLLLLLFAAQFQAFDSPVGQSGDSSTPAEHPEFSGDVVLVPETNAPAAVHRCYEDIKRTLGLSFVPNFYMSVARWPDFLQLYWDTLRPISRSPVYEGCHYGSRETAFTLVREFPAPLEFSIGQLSEAGISDDDIGSIIRILEMFVNAFSASALNVAAAKIALEGGTGRPAQSQKIEPSGAKSEKERAA